MASNDQILCVDWGTSSFRASLVDVHSEQILKSFRNVEGCKVVYQECLKSQTDPFDFFHDKLLTIIHEQEIKASDYKEVLISGMAGSTIGMQSLPYAQLPFSMDGRDLFSQSFTSAQLGKMTLISGVAAKEDIMRGEETQLIGLARLIDLEDSVLIIPGTHAKHLKIQGGQLVDFKTYMTGELFQLLAEQSVLSRTVKKSSWSEKMEEEFARGVNDAKKPQVLHDLFRIRARDILGKSKGSEAEYYYLSGLIIGNELLSLQDSNKKKIFACDDKMRLPYFKAAATLALTETSFIDSALLSNSYLVGQLTFFKQR